MEQKLQKQETIEKVVTQEAAQAPKRRPGDYQDIPLFKDVNPIDWEDWHWQVKHSIRKADELRQIINLTSQEEDGLKNAKGRLSMAITPYWASFMDAEDADCSFRRQAVPTSLEFFTTHSEMADPCAEDRDSPVPGLVHRYPDRVLLLATEHCAMYCRHCTRRRLVGDRKEDVLSLQTLDLAINYIRSNKKIRDVLISGGDPLMLEDNVIDEILGKVRSIPHVEFVRIGTRTPVSLPQRINEGLIKTLKKYSPLWISIHFNHYREVTRRTKEACNLLADNGFVLGSQTVLLKGINDRTYVMRKLMHELLQIRVRPYYIYQCDPVKGTSHFRTPVSVGINIVERLRGFTSGYAVPTYVIDGPGGGGKIPISPNYLLSQAKGKYVLRNYKGKIYTYLE